MSEMAILKGSKNLIVCFGGFSIKIGGIIPFEFLHYLSKEYSNNEDLLFYIDKKQSLYHEGIDSISNSIEETVVYLTNKIENGGYEKVIFMGTSAGGYAAILFGSLCKVTNVVAFIPPTKLKNPKYKEYRDLIPIINPTTHYLLYGDLSVKNINCSHHIQQCERLTCTPYNISAENTIEHNMEKRKNVTLVKKTSVDLKTLRDSGEIKSIIDSIITSNSGISEIPTRHLLEKI